ncbi:MAG: fibrobacter succinogenes major paralogous domain-containing protein [Fibromonadaceae bacterium]|jgi:uncharacterized protein (TIGR02145 family)|nr:fibrobacter succinogenes major paralogous domain-containing protein [Fibromonadaceae bacterium]
MKTQTLLKSIFGVAFIALLLPMVSCDSSGSSALVGHWLHESGSTDKKPEDMELLKDGTGVCDGVSISWKVEDKRFIIQSSSLGMVSDYEVSGYRLTLTSNGEKSTYVNVNKDYLQKGSFTDSRDNKKYGTIKIGDQTWMSENLNYEAGGKCYDNDPANCAKYGRLYDWKTALSVCPKGWHLPSKEEWHFAGGDEVAGKKFKARSGWNNNQGKSGNGTDIYGFSALPGGYGGSGGGFHYVGNYGIWWSASEGNSDFAYYRYMDYYREYVGYGDYDKDFLFSVRCLQD